MARGDRKNDLKIEDQRDESMNRRNKGVEDEEGGRAKGTRREAEESSYGRG